MFKVAFDFRGYEISFYSDGTITLTSPDANYETGFDSVEDAINRVLELEEKKSKS
jgi:hypothetical protein